MKNDDRFAVVLVTAPVGDDSERLARSLVEERLAACVNRIGPVRSVYRWKEKVEQETEELLVVKTRRSLLVALAARVRELHPYDVPEIIALPVDAGSEPYLRWLAGATREEGP